MKRLAVSSFELADDLHDWFLVLCNQKGYSKRELMGQMVTGHIIRWRRRLIADVADFAHKNQLTWEQAHALLSSDRKTPYTESDLAWARALEESECRTTLAIEQEKISPLPNTDAYPSAAQ